METEILNKILVQVEKIGTDLNEFKEEVRERFDRNEKELAEFKGEMYKFKDEMYEFKGEMYKFKDEMYDFRTEVYDLFDKNTQEISDEIHEVARMMSRKTKQAVKEVKDEIRQELKAYMKVNEKAHNVFQCQIEELECIKEYIPKLYFKLIEMEQAEKITA